MGYDQTLDYCQFMDDGNGSYVCTDFGNGQCSNGYTERTCWDNASPIAIYQPECATTHAPSKEPTDAPTQNPTTRLQIGEAPENTDRTADDILSTTVNEFGSNGSLQLPWMTFGAIAVLVC